MARDVMVSGKILAAVLRAGLAAGLDTEAALARAGLEAADIANPDTRFPVRREIALFEAFAEESGDPAFALRAARNVDVGDFDVLEYVARSAATIGEAMEGAVRYMRLIHDAALIGLEVDGDTARLTHRYRDGQRPHRHAADYTLAVVVVLVSGLLGRPFQPREVWFQHPAPDDDSAFRELFRAPLRFAQPISAVVFDRADLAARVVSADASLHRILRRHADELLERMPAAEDVVLRCREEISTRTMGGDTSLEAVARAMGMSGRTLQRRLRDEGVAYKELVSELRAELATALLREPKMSVAEVGYLLGYSQPSAFHRAFRSWTGRSPASVRP